MAGAHPSPYASGTDSNFAGSPPVQHQISAQSAQSRDGATHQRTYQACIPCRRRKVRCDLGSVDNPHDPPCLRCRREAKECYFSSTRRKKRGDTDDAEAPEVQDYAPKTGRKRMRASEPGEDEYAEPVERPRTPGGSIGRSQPLRRPAPVKGQMFGEEDMLASEKTTALLQAKEVHGGHDALKVLMEAAGIGAARSSSAGNHTRPLFSGLSSATLPPSTSPITERVSMSTSRGQAWPSRPPQGPAAMHIAESMIMDAPGYKAAIRAWSRYRFVRGGWFTAKEGIAYVLYFYRYLSPLTPVTLPDFNNLESHERLLTEEPMLALTVLLIASRHMPLEGPGSTTRPSTIHQKLWEYLKGMIDRVTWGQEQFGGGFCGAGAQPGCDVNPLTRKGLRTLGTVESLMLLTEWHPRAMHFPPDEADDELMMPDIPLAMPDESADDGKGIGGQRMDSWLEPCWRSDRMCWMLLGMAMSLAFEIGVFDKSEWQRHAITPTGQPMSAEEMHNYDKRRGNVRDLLLIYVTMTSGRLGLTSMLPNNYSKPEDSELFKTQIGEHISIQETVLQFWLRIAAIMRDCNKKIFANKAFTRDLIKNGSYKAVLEQFRQPLAQWRRDFDECAVIPKFMQYILQIEYEYSRVYLNALSLQAVAERCANDIPQVNDPPMDVSRPTVSTNGVRTDVAISPQTLHKWLGGDRVYMNEVRDAACALLTVVVKGLYPGQYLRHAPVRTYFRIISVAIMLLKSFSLGASENDIADSLKLLDQTVDALRNCIVDDVHVASRFADLLDVLVQNLKPRLKRITTDGQGNSRKQSVRTTPVSGAEAGMAASQSQYYGGTTKQAWSYGASTQQGVSPGSYGMDSTQGYSVMPPPSFGHPNGAAVPTTQDNYSSAFANDSNGFGNTYGDLDLGQDWFALPLDPLLGLAGADVNQTMYGPEVGGHDMLEVLFNDGRNYQ